MRVPGGGEINVLYNPSAFSLCFSLAIWIRELVGNVLLEVDVTRDSSAAEVGKSYQISSELGKPQILPRPRARPSLLGDDNFLTIP